MFIITMINALIKKKKKMKVKKFLLQESEIILIFKQKKIGYFLFTYITVR